MFTLATIEQACHQGSWAYDGGKQASLEATAICAIACRANKKISEQATSFLVETQNKDGGWATLPGSGASDWSSSLAVLALNTLSPHLEAQAQARAQAAATRGVEFICGSRTNRFMFLGSVFSLLVKGPDYDYARGWSWYPQTYQWAEPTAYALMALSTSAMAANKEVREVITLAQEFLVRKACKGGGWNYGCPRILGTELPPQAAVSAIVLTALQGLPATSAVSESLTYLNAPAPDKNTTLARAWTAICKSAWNQDMTKVMPEKENATTAASMTPGLVVQALSLIASAIPECGNPFKYTI